MRGAIALFFDIFKERVPEASLASPYLDVSCIALIPDYTRETFIHLS